MLDWLEFMAAHSATTQSIDLVNQYMDDVVTGREYDRLAELLTEDFVHHGTPSGAEHQGLEASEGMLRMFHAAFSDLESTEVHSMADEAGEYVCSVRTYTGTHDGEFMGHGPTGSSMEIMAIGLYRIEGGRIAELWNAEDYLGLLQQLDVVPPMDELAG